MFELAREDASRAPSSQVLSRKRKRGNVLGREDRAARASTSQLQSGLPTPEPSQHSMHQDVGQAGPEISSTVVHRSIKPSNPFEEPVASPSHEPNGVDVEAELSSPIFDRASSPEISLFGVLEDKGKGEPRESSISMEADVATSSRPINRQKRYSAQASGSSSARGPPPPPSIRSAGDRHVSPPGVRVLPLNAMEDDFMNGAELIQDVTFELLDLPDLAQIPWRATTIGPGMDDDPGEGSKAYMHLPPGMCYIIESTYHAF